MRRTTILLMILAAIVLIACRERGNGYKNEAIDNSQRLPGDKMVYGLACDGCTDSILVFLPNEGGDPISYNIITAMSEHKVFGHPEVGDWVGILLNPKDSTDALFVVDLDQLKGTWTYQVLPTIRESSTKSQSDIQAEITDSMRELLFVPREYGFTLKRHRAAIAVGNIYKGNSLTTEMVVEYPPVPTYTGWMTWNGKLILVRDTMDMKTKKRIHDSKVERDTMDFVYMLDDSLALRYKGKVIGFHRQQNAFSANKKAQDAAKKQAAADTIKR